MSGIEFTFKSDTSAIKHRLTVINEAALNIRGPVDEAAEFLAGQIKIKLASHGSHARGTPTPSPPGSAPAMISGALRNSVTAGQLRVARGSSAGGQFASGGAPGVYSTHVGPNTVYARIQEFGGVCGRNHATVLPARPYMAPTLAENESQVRQIILDGFKREAKL